MKQVLITGAAGGLGGAAASYFAEKGVKVYALDINQDALDRINNPNIIPVYCNITDKVSVESAVREVMKATDRLDAVINMAGVLYMGSAVETDEALMDRILKINMLGMYTVNKYFFPFVKVGGGRIINVGSELGWLSAQPFNSLYCASKYAVEAYSDSLRREMLFQGIKVIKVNPGSFKTDIHGAAEKGYRKMLDNTVYYKDVIRKMEPLMIGELKHAKDPVILAKAIYKAFAAKRPKLCYKVNTSKKLKLLNLLPDGMQDFIYKFVFTKILK